MDLQDKVAFVTGASEGLGRAIVEELVRRGAKVAGMARSRDKLEDLAERLGDSFMPLTGDVRQAEDVERAVQAVRDQWQTVHILVNNAGIGRYDEVDQVPLEDWQQQMETNVTGTFLATRTMTLIMKEQKLGHIVNIASIASLIGTPRHAAYNASKYAVRGFSEAIMKELREYGIKVTCVFPGSINTPFFDKAGRERHGHMMDPHEIARTIAFILATSDNYLIDTITMRPLNPKPPETEADPEKGGQARG